MKKIFTINIYLFALLILSLLSACSNGDGDSSTGTSKAANAENSSTEAILTGVVADGYLKNAKVFLDRNENRVYDNGEPLAQSTVGGVFSLDVNPGEGELYPVVVQIIAGETIDEDSGATIVNDYFLESLPGRWEFISPLTTLVKLECDKNPSFSPLQAEIEIRTRFGLDDSISLFADYIAAASGEAVGAEEYGRAHRAAQVAANIMGSLRASLSHNLNGQIADTEQVIAAYMISDQILGQATLIKVAFDNERNQVGVMDVSSVTDAILDTSDTESLNADLLFRYQQRLEQDFATWDMQAPQLQSQSPAAGDTASVDTIISIVFDEELDETLLVDGVITLSGPNGVVSGSLDYDAEHAQLSFVPSQLLVPFSHYQVVVDGTLADLLGNPLGVDITWEFTTTFDQTPPPLPVF